MPFCSLCEREVEIITEHHLIPKTRHKNKKNKKMFTREEVKTSKVLLCKPCHNNIHAHLTEKELERNYNTLEKLKLHPDIAKFTNWIKNKPGDTKVPNKKHKGRK
jgi:hypothetical protein